MLQLKLRKTARIVLETDCDCAPSDWTKALCLKAMFRQSVHQSVKDEPITENSNHMPSHGFSLKIFKIISIWREISVTMQKNEHNSKRVRRGCSRNISLSSTLQERKLLRSRLDSIGTLAVNSFPKVLSTQYSRKKKKKKELNEYSPVRQACYARGEVFITDFQITGEQHWNMCDFFLFVKKTFSIDPSCVVALYDSQSYFSTK